MGPITGVGEADPHLGPKLGELIIEGGSAEQAAVNFLHAVFVKQDLQLIEVTASTVEQLLNQE